MVTFNATEDSHGELAKMLGQEWLETDGRGGWASSTVACVNTRRYHGMLVSGEHFPATRLVLVSKVEETLQVGEARVALSTNQYPDAVFPHGFLTIRSFVRDIFPVWEFEAAGARLRKTVASIH